MKRILKKFWWLFVILVIIVIAVFYFVGKEAGPQYEYTTDTVIKGDIIQTVEATGSVESSEAIELAFTVAGVLREKYIEVGDQVKLGDNILKLDDRELKYALTKASASLQKARADLNQVLAGSSSEDVVVSQRSVDKAHADYLSALDSLENIKLKYDTELVKYQKLVIDAQANLDRANQDLLDVSGTQGQNIENLRETALSVMGKALADCEVSLDEVNDILGDSDISNHYAVSNPNARNSEIASRELAQNFLAVAKSLLSVALVSKSDSDIDNAINNVDQTLDYIYDNLQDMYSALSGTITSTSFTQTTLNTYKSNITTRQVTISSDISSLESAKQNLINGRITEDTQSNTYQSAVISAQNALALAETNYDLAIVNRDSQVSSAQNSIASYKASYDLTLAQLDLKKAPPRSVDVASYLALVNQLSAGYELANKQWQDAWLKAPMDGTVTKINFDIGERVNTTNLVAEMVSLNNFEIEVDISESDITKIKVEDLVEITLDAFSDDEIFEGRVVHIEPAQTVIQEVIYYKVKIEFNQEDARIKPGMTANTTIFTDEKKDVLYVPRRAVIDKNGEGKFIRILDGSSHREISITTGLRADDGLIEVLDGISEGEEIVTYMKEVK